MKYHFPKCYEMYRPHADVEGFAECIYNIILKELDYPLDQSVVRRSPIFQKYKEDVYNFSIECNKPPYKVLRRVPPTRVFGKI